MGRGVLPLAGLIIATEDGCQAAQLPVAGQTLIELMVRTLRAAGAGHIVVLVDQLPAALVSAFDRLRDAGINIDVAREVRDAADRIHPEEQLLVASDSIIADLSLMEALAASEQPRLLTVPASQAMAGLERIDAVDHWTGLALIDGQLLRDTVAALGDWSLGPTLLRTTLAAGSVRMSVPEGHVFGRVSDIASAQAMSRRFAETGGAEPQGLVERHLFAPLSRLIAPHLLTRAIPVDLVSVLPLVLLGSALLLALGGWQASALVAAFVAGFPALMGRAMASAGLRESRALSLFSTAFLVVVGIILLIFGWQLWSGPAGWGGMVVALWAVCIFCLGRPPKTRVAEPEIWLLTLLVAALFGHLLTGFGLLIAANMIQQLYFRWKER